ncbi:MAG: hypothetical protein NC299_07325 [Lachnospiraceae bacterium]|nr:hypothetical protein [Ruminococcus sp.]MCM1275165.1 hypothetical protein [Lachnospiraceae bacterium]
MKKFKKTLAAVLSAATLLTVGASTTIAFASGDDKSAAEYGLVLMEDIPSFDEMVLVGEGESVKDGLRYVVEVYSPEAVMLSSTGNHVDYFAVMRVYNDSTQDSVALMQMKLGGAFSWNENENTVSVDTYYQPAATSLTYQKYPIITPKGLESKNNYGGAFFGDKYAYIKYTVDMEKSSGNHITCTLELDVNVKGEKTVKCSPANIAFKEN